MKKHILMIGVIILALAQSAGTAKAEQVSSDSLLVWMGRCVPLPKVHYTWTIDSSTPESWLIQLARLTWTMTWNLASTPSQATVTRYVTIADSLNKANHPTTFHVALGLAYAPYETSARYDTDDPRADGSVEIAYIEAQLTAWKTKIDSANVLLSLTGDDAISLGCLVYDTERFERVPTDSTFYAEWNTACTDKYNAVWDATKAIFPDARIEMYGIGAITQKSRWDGFVQTFSYSYDDSLKTESFSIPLYHMREPRLQQDMYRWTTEHARRHGITKTIPWFALGTGYTRLITSAFQDYSVNLDYGLPYAFIAGQEFNWSWYSSTELLKKRFAPWDDGDIGILYPSPFDDEALNWGRYFVAYCNGARSTASWAGVTPYVLYANDGIGR